jgi:hypothetical protein
VRSQRVPMLPLKKAYPEDKNEVNVDPKEH